MKKIFYLLFILTASNIIAQETIKSKALKLKYSPPAGWNAEEFGGKTSWEESGNTLCKCSGVAFYRTHKDGKMNVVVYPSSQSGLDSAKRNFVGNLRFENVEKYDKTKNKFFSFERRKSNFTDYKTNKKSYEVIRYLAKVEDHYYIIYAWQESMNPLNSTNEKEIYQMVNAIEPM
jgi:hypothetical protein